MWNKLSRHRTICTGSSSPNSWWQRVKSLAWLWRRVCPLCLWMCVCLCLLIQHAPVFVHTCVCVCVCAFIPARVLTAPPAAPAGVVHHTGLRTDPPRAVSQSKTKTHARLSILTGWIKMKCIMCDRFLQSASVSDHFSAKEQPSLEWEQQLQEVTSGQFTCSV